MSRDFVVIELQCHFAGEMELYVIWSVVMWVLGVMTGVVAMNCKIRGKERTESEEEEKVDGMRGLEQTENEGKDGMPEKRGQEETENGKGEGADGKEETKEERRAQSSDWEKYDWDIECDERENDMKRKKRMEEEEVKRQKQVEKEMREYDWAVHRRVRENIRCYKCGKRGHYAGECEEEVRCFYCKKEGHIARDCEKLKYQSGEKAKRKTIKE